MSDSESVQGTTRAADEEIHAESNDEDYMLDFQTTLENLLDRNSEYADDAETKEFPMGIDIRHEKIDSSKRQEEITKYGSIKGNSPPMPITSWIDCGISDKIEEVLNEMKCKQPVAVQCLSIPAILESRDVVVVAETGSGKTLCYCIPIARVVAGEKQRHGGKKGPFAAVIVCSRELADQIGEILRRLLTGTGIKICVAHGGRDVSRDLADVSTSCDIFIGCPGRTVDILTKRKSQNLFARIKFIAFDEADRLFDEGFRPQVEKMSSLLPKGTQKAMFTATMPGFIAKSVKKMLSDPLHIYSGTRLGISHTLEQNVEVFQKEEDRFFRLLEILGEYVTQRKQVLVFVEKRNDLEELYISLQMHGHKCLTIYAEMDPIDRASSLKEFTSTEDENDYLILISTGLGGRGLDIPSLSLVINYTTPPCLEEYIHRVGRTARQKNGKSISFLLQPHENLHSLYLLQALQDSKVDGSTIDTLRKVAEEVSGDSKLILWTPKESFKSYAGHGYSFDEEERKKSHKKRRVYQREKMHALGMISHALPDNQENSRALVVTDEKSPIDRPNTAVVQSVVKATGKELSVKIGDAKARALAIAAAIGEARELEATTTSHSVRLLINDYSIRIRRMLTNRTMMRELIDDINVDMSYQGEYRKGVPVDNKLHLLLNSDNKLSVEKAKEKVEAFIRHELKFEVI